MTPRQFGHYRLDSLLGSGGMGDVYRAYDTSRDRYVALKLLQEAYSDDREYLARFQRESNVAARLTEPHIIPIHDFGAIDGRLFIDMRLVEGADIGALLDQNGPMAPQRVVDLLFQVALALDAAHADQLVHRDIKPSNILVTAGDFVYVVDFGIARSIGSRQTPLTVTGTTIGTWAYMAPERFEGKVVDGRADIYSLACVLHECLTGAAPFSGKDHPAMLYAHLYSDPPPASSLAAGIPVGLDAVIARGMAKNPDDRFATAGQLVAAARAALGTGESAPPPPRPVEHLDYVPSVRDLPAEPPQARDRGPRDAPATVPPLVFPTRADHRVGTEDMPLPPSPDPDGHRLPVDAATGGPARGPARRRLVPLIAGVAVLAAVPVAIILLANGNTNHNNGSTTNTGGATGTATASPARGTSTVAPSLAMPTAGQTITVGQTPNFIAVAPNGKFAYITNPGTRAVSVLDTATDKVTKTIAIAEGQPQAVSFSPDSQTAYVSLYGSHLPPAVAFIDTATGTETGTPVQVDNIMPGVSATSPDGRFLYVANHNMVQTGASDRLIDVIDLTSRKLVNSISVLPNPHWVAIDPANGRMYVTDHMQTHVTVLNAQTGAVITTIEVGETPHSEALSPDGSRLAVTSYNGNEVFVINTATNQELSPIPVGRLPLDIAYSPDGRYLFTVNNDDNTVTVIDTADYKVIGTIPVGKSPTSIAVLPDGRQAYVTDEDDGTIQVINLPK